jgi:glycosyltransferase involved in cell wall biosynthesis
MMQETRDALRVEPRVSVIIPTYNRAELLSQTIESVLVQTRPDFELIVVDDGSTDSTVDLIEGYRDARLRYIYQDNAGGCAARNRGATESRTPHVVFLDSDDLFMPDALAELMGVADRYPETGLIGGGFEYIDATGHIIGEYQPWLLGEQLDLTRWLLDCPFIPSATMIKRSCFEAVGGFDLEQEAAQDWDLWLRMAAAGCVMRWLKRSVCKYRLHGGGLTVDIERQKRGYMRALGKHLGDDHHSPAVLAVRGEAYANAYLHAAAREYAVGQIETAQEDVREAAKFAPDWIDSGILLERLLRQGQSPLITDTLESYVSTVLSHLPPGIFTARSRNRALARVAAASLFANAGRQNRSKMSGLWWRVVLNDPAWLRNLGFLSIGLQSLLGPRVVPRIKKVLRR